MGIRGTGSGRDVRAGIGPACMAYAFWAVMLGTTLATPLYPIYQQQFGFGSLVTTVVFAVYAAGVIFALLFGRSSDALGRRRVMLAGVAVSMTAAVVYLVAGDVPVLLAARVLSGLSAGVVTATGTVTLVELVRPERRGGAALLAAAVNMFGLGCGPLLAGLLAEYAPHPLAIPFVVDLVLLALAFVAVLVAPETVRDRRTIWPRAQRPAVPAEVRPVFVPAAIAAFAAFAVFGLVTAVVPGILVGVLHRPDRALAGLVVFAMFGASTAGQVMFAKVPERIALPAGCAVLVVGLAAIAGALLAESLPLLVTGPIVVGLGQSLGFRAGLAAVTAGTPAAQRAQTVSSFFLTAYAGISLPVVLVGVAASAFGLRSAAVAFTAAVAVLALAALVALLRLERRHPVSQGPETDRSPAAHHAGR
ncbi:MFS transporter [Actinomadura opuntiae]|uniref:MFS transporter n=1 Tax=Actinomadura sp. OS1-43 TaxID=604315 RepID=UPI00255A91EE|nr:MFS transporter [Actinomadura sp. OS1-43]MDL4814648.1 MFS transporter [Actinomadura sp. OS1-43]